MATSKEVIGRVEEVCFAVADSVHAFLSERIERHLTSRVDSLSFLLMWLFTSAFGFSRC